MPVRKPPEKRRMLTANDPYFKDNIVAQAMMNPFSIGDDV